MSYVNGGLYAAATVTATATANSSAKDFLSTEGGPRNGYVGRIRIPSLIATAAVTATLTLQESSATDSLWRAIGQREVVVASATVTNTLPISVPFKLTQRYVRRQWSFSNTTSGLVLQDVGDLGLSYPP